MARSSLTPFSLAAIWARRSAMLSAGLRDGCGALRSISIVSDSRSVPFSTSSQLRMRTPSSSMWLLNAGMEPGVMPPISAW
jgi:hypothetical protein